MQLKKTLHFPYFQLFRHRTSKVNSDTNFLGSPCHLLCAEALFPKTWGVKKEEKVKYLAYSVEISGFYCHHEFTWNQFSWFLKDINCHFNHFRGSEFTFWEKFTFENWKIPKISKFGATEMSKKAVFETQKTSKIDFT